MKKLKWLGKVLLLIILVMPEAICQVYFSEDWERDTIDRDYNYSCNVYYGGCGFRTNVSCFHGKCLHGYGHSPYHTTLSWYVEHPVNIPNIFRWEFWGTYAPGGASWFKLKSPHHTLQYDSSGYGSLSFDGNTFLIGFTPPFVFKTNGTHWEIRQMECDPFECAVCFWYWTWNGTEPIQDPRNWYLKFECKRVFYANENFLLNLTENITSIEMGGSVNTYYGNWFNVEKFNILGTSCPNNICEPELGENYQNCALDCPYTRCYCSDWVAQECINSTHRRYTRECNPPGCDIEEKYEYDPSCAKKIPPIVLFLILLLILLVVVMFIYRE